MRTLQYRLTKVGGGKAYQVMITWALLHTEIVGTRPTQKEARQLAKEHAARNNVNPIILT